MQIVQGALFFFCAFLLFIAIDRLIGTAVAGLNERIVKKRKELIREISDVRREFYSRDGAAGMPIQNYASFVETMEHVGLDADLLMKQTRKDALEGSIDPMAQLVSEESLRKNVFSTISKSWPGHIGRVFQERRVLAELRRHFECRDWTGIEMTKLPIKRKIKIIF